MRKKQDKTKTNQGVSLFLSIIFVFAVLACIVFSVSHKISREMSESAVQNLDESLRLIKSTIEAILNQEAEYQKLMAQEIAESDNLEEHITHYSENQTMVKISLINIGETEGITSAGEIFTEDGLDFTAEKTVDGVDVSKSYVNYMGTWAYTMRCPVMKNGEETALLYVEYIYDSFDKSLPEGFYNKRAMLYIMDAETERFILKPKGMGERNAGHLNLSDYYRANEINEKDIRDEVAECLRERRNIMFYHDIRGKDSLNYMWAVNGGTIYLVGYVPIEAIQQEGRTVNQNIFIVVAVMLIAFFICCILYYLNQRQQNRTREEREKEREIHNRQLAEALQAAQIASSSKTTFLSNMSHDIRTPMNAVLGFTTLLARDAENPGKVREYTKKINASGQHLLSLINDILDVSKIESGKVVLSVEEFTLNDLVSSINALIRPMAQDRGQKFFVEVTDIKHEYLLGDETRINQILINLLSNAVKYTQEGGSIWFRIIGLKQRSSQYEPIRIEVEDNGYGMTQEYLKTIFDAFTRAENSTTNKVQGTGLGMAITKNLVELMGGTIDVFSEEGKGSLFRVEIELRIPEGQMEQQFWAGQGVSRILAADRDSGVCRNIQILMEEAGVTVDQAQTLEEAVSFIQNKQGQDYQAVLLDSHLSGPAFEQMVQSIREMLPDVVPILLLADHGADETDEIIQTENIGVLSKPFFVSAFKEKLLEMQSKKAGHEPVQPAQDSRLEGLNFLAAEDNEINAEILREIITIENAGCEIVENGKLAVERFMNSEKNEFDAILMDVQMPVMNGYDATRAIRTLARDDARDIPIIAMTANAFAEDEKDALNAGMNMHLTKPIDVELLKQVLRQYTKKQEVE